MKKTILNMIGIELCIAGWEDDAIEKEQFSMSNKDEEDLSSIYWDLRVKRMEHNQNHL